MEAACRCGRTQFSSLRREEAQLGTRSGLFVLRRPRWYPGQSILEFENIRQISYFDYIERKFITLLNIINL